MSNELYTQYPSDLLIKHHLAYKKETMWIGGFSKLGQMIAVAERNYIFTVEQDAASISRSIPTLLNRIKAPEVKKCFQQMQHLTQELSKTGIIQPSDRFCSFNTIMISWLMDLISLYRFNAPDDDSIIEIQFKIGVLLAEWRYDQKEKTHQSKLEENFELIKEKLRHVYPDYENYVQAWKAFHGLINDPCQHKLIHWDPEISPSELEYWIRPKKNTIENIPKALFIQIWKIQCHRTTAFLHFALPIVEGKCCEVQARLKEKIRLCKDNQLAQDIDIFCRDIRFSFFSNKIVPLKNVIKRISETSFELLPNLINQFTEVNDVLKIWDKAPNFSSMYNDDTTYKNLSIVYKNDTVLAREIADFRNEILNLCHKLLDTFFAVPLMDLMNLWKAVIFNHQLEIAALKADEIGQMLLDEEKKQKKTKKIKHEHSAVICTVKAKTKKEEILPLASPLIIESRDVTLQKTHSLKAGLNAASDPELIAAAAHTDFYHQLLEVNEAVLQQEKIQQYPLLMLRMGYHNAHLLTENLLNYQIKTRGMTGNVLCHNLYSLSAKTKQDMYSSVIRNIYNASLWTRFPHSQRAHWEEMITTGNMPLVLQDLHSPKETKTRHRLITNLKEVRALSLEEIARLGQSSICKAPQNTEIKPSKAPELPHLEQLLLALPKSTANLWLEQLKDDLTCLKSVLMLYFASENLGEHALYTNYSSSLLHNSAQSLLYALLQKQGVETHEHDLVRLAKMLTKQTPPRITERLNDLLLHASVTSRYPFEYVQPQSEIHRLQLQAIALFLSPDLAEGYKPVVHQKRESTLELRLQGIPLLSEYTNIIDQRESLKKLSEDLCLILKDTFLPLMLF